jgi:hypothetical protein
MPRSNTILEDGRPAVVAVATAIASGMGSPAVRATPSQRDSWVIGSGSTDDSSMATVCSLEGRGSFEIMETCQRLMGGGCDARSGMRLPNSAHRTPNRGNQRPHGCRPALHR